MGIIIAFAYVCLLICLSRTGQYCSFLFCLDMLHIPSVHQILTNDTNFQYAKQTRPDLTVSA